MRKFNFKKLTPKYVFTKRSRFLHLKNHPFAVPVFTLLALLFVTGIAYVFVGSQTLGPGNSHVVIVSYDNKKQAVPTTADTVGELLKRLDIKLNEGDIVEPIADTEIVEDNYRVNVYRAKPVTIDDGNKKVFALSAATTPRSIAAQAGIKVYPEDDLTVKIPDSFLRTANIGQELVIDRATPVIVNLYGTPVGVRTHTETVADLLKDKHITVAEGDTIDPVPSTKIQPNMSVVISRKGTKIATVIEPVPFPSQTVEDPTLSFGTTATRQQGANGKRVVTYEIKIVNGKEVSRRKIQEVIAEKPVPAIVARGKAIYIPKDRSVIMQAAGIKQSDYPYVNYIINHENALWCPTRWQGQTHCPPYYEPRYSPDAMVGYGLCQSTPGSKMASAGSDWKTNAVTQLKWCSGYAHDRYGSWSAAYNFWVANHHW